MNVSGGATLCALQRYLRVMHGDFMVSYLVIIGNVCIVFTTCVSSLAQRTFDHLHSPESEFHLCICRGLVLIRMEAYISPMVGL